MGKTPGVVLRGEKLIPAASVQSISNPIKFKSMSSSPINPISLLRTRLDLLQTLRRLSAEQLSLIEADNDDETACVVDVKEAVVRRLAVWQQDHFQLLENWERLESEFDAQTQQRCSELRQLSETELAEFKRNEQESTALLQTRRDRVHQELSSLNRGAKTLAAYGNTVANGSNATFDVNQ